MCCLVLISPPAVSNALRYKRQYGCLYAWRMCGTLIASSSRRVPFYSAMLFCQATIGIYEYRLRHVGLHRRRRVWCTDDVPLCDETVYFVIKSSLGKHNAAHLMLSQNIFTYGSNLLMREDRRMIETCLFAQK